MENNYKYFKKSSLNRLPITEFLSDIPELKDIYESKSMVIATWLANKIEEGLKSGNFKIYDVLPKKSDFAYHLGVSIGTMQNTYRHLEDMGYVESKQCIGTLIRDYNNQVSSIRKLTSKRDLASEAIKRYILNDKFAIGEIMPSARTISTIIGFGANTTRQALEYLASQGIVEYSYKNSREFGCILKSLDFSLESYSDSKKSKTLVDIIVKDLENYIISNLHVGDKMPPHMVLSKSLKTSIKTVHDALKVLIDRGIILARRGKYGSIIVKMPNSFGVSQKPEMSIFAPAKDTAFYHYEKTQNNIKRLISEKYNIGDKLPSIMDLSSQMDLSPNTIRKAFHNLAKEGYLVFSRGRYGGTFVIDIPEVEGQSFKWLAVNPQYAKEYSNNLS